MKIILLFLGLYLLNAIAGILFPLPRVKDRQEPSIINRLLDRVFFMFKL